MKRKTKITLLEVVRNEKKTLTTKSTWCQVSCYCSRKALTKRAEVRTAGGWRGGIRWAKVQVKATKQEPQSSGSTVTTYC